MYRYGSPGRRLCRRPGGQQCYTLYPKLSRGFHHNHCNTGHYSRNCFFIGAFVIKKSADGTPLWCQLDEDLEDPNELEEAERENLCRCNEYIDEGDANDEFV